MESLPNRNVIAGVIGLLVLGFVGLYGQTKIREAKLARRSTLKVEAPKSTSSADSPTKRSEISDRVIVVDITGEIVKPGVYEIRGEARVEKLIELAGGFTEKADINSVNRAAKLADGMKVVVPPKTEPKTSSSRKSKVVYTTPNRDKLKMQPAVSRASRAREDDSENDRPDATLKININRAPRDILLEIPGMSSANADAIIEYRNVHGSIRSFGELEGLPTFDASVVAQMRGHIKLFEETGD
jgi:competence protein ComEA